MTRDSSAKAVQKGLPAPRKALKYLDQEEAQNPRSALKVLVLLTGTLESDSLTFLDTLRIREEATYVLTEDTQGEDVAGYAKGASVISARSLLEHYVSKSFDALFLPGQRGEPEVDREVCSAVIQTLYDDECDVIATGSGRMHLVATHVVKGKGLSSHSLDVEVADQVYAEHSNSKDIPGGDDRICWVDSPITQWFNVWTAAGTAEAVRSLAYYYKAVRRGGMVYSTIFPIRLGVQTRSVGRAEGKSGSAEELAGLIASSPSSEASRIAYEVVGFAVNLGLQGFVSLCNSLLLKLLRVLPDAFSEGGRVNGVDRQTLELIWKISEQRPAVPWEAPSDAEMYQWESELRGRCSYPSEEDLPDILEAVKLRLDLDTEFAHMPPYTIAGAVSMALEAGWAAEAEEWLTYLIQISDPRSCSYRVQIQQWRKVVEYAMSGILAKILGRTTEDGARDAATVSQALDAYPATSAARDEYLCMVDRSIAAAPLSSLVPMLATLTHPDLEEEATLLRPPASPSAIADAESRLGVQLPEDLKQFLMLSNGIGPTSTCMPGLRNAEALCWEDPDALGFEWFRIDLGVETSPSCSERLPKPKRILRVSDDQSEECLILVEPSDVEEAMHVLHGLGQPADVPGMPGWRVFYFVHWSPSSEWLSSFRAYIERMAKDALESGPVMSQEVLSSRL